MKNNYPLTLLKTKPSPILGSKFKTTPLLLSTVNAPFNKIKYNFEDQKKYNADLYATLKKSKHD
ncbi:hypothetical protein FACS189459_1080 [Bacilli bacterium]|nr:hypothetical protein FACS189459_1080 [Bacilli bacterium]